MRPRLAGLAFPVALLAVAMSSGFSAAQDYTKGDTLDICDGFNTFWECLDHVAHPGYDRWEPGDYQEYGTASALAKWRTSKKRPECDTLQHSMQLAFPASGKFWDKPDEVPEVEFLFASLKPEYDGLDGFTAKYTAISDSGQRKEDCIRRDPAKLGLRQIQNGRGSSPFLVGSWSCA